MIDVKHGRLSLHVGEENIGFNLSQAMSSYAIEDAYYWINVLEKVLSKEAMSIKPPEDPLGTCLVGAP